MCYIDGAQLWLWLWLWRAACIIPAPTASGARALLVFKTGFGSNRAGLARAAVVARSKFNCEHTHTHGGGASGSGIWGAIIESRSKWQATQCAHCVFFLFFFFSFFLLIRRVSPTLHPRYWRTCIGPTGCQHAPHDALPASCRTAASACSSHRPMWAPMRRWPCTVIRSDPGCLHGPRRRITCRHLRRVHRRRRTR